MIIPNVCLFKIPGTELFRIKVMIMFLAALRPRLGSILMLFPKRHVDRVTKMVKGYKNQITRDNSRN